MARDGFDAEAVSYTKSDPPDISKSKAKNGLDNGVHFISRMSLQAASNSLFMHLVVTLDPKRAQGGFAGTFRTGDSTNLVGPFDERNRTVRDLLHVLLAQSKGAMWMTLLSYAAIPNTTPSRSFWTFLEYTSSEEQRTALLVAAAQEIRQSFGARSSEPDPLRR